MPLPEKFACQAASSPAKGYVAHDRVRQVLFDGSSVAKAPLEGYYFHCLELGYVIELVVFRVCRAWYLSPRPLHQPGCLRTPGRLPLRPSA